MSGATGGFNFGAALQDVLTRGLDVAQTVVNSRFHVNDPAAQVTGPQGTSAQVGQPANAGAALKAVPTWVWFAAAAGVVGLVLVLRK